MSLEMNVNVENVVVKDKVMRTLPAKYNKFAGFAYWLLGQMKDAQVLSANGYDDTCVMMNLLSGDIPMQIEFYEKFFTEAPVSGRLMKAEMKTFKDKSSKKDKKEKKEKVVKEKKENMVKEKKSKKVNNQVSNTNNDIISQIVMRANSVETIAQPVIEQPVVVEKKKRVKKDKVVIVEPTELASAVEPTELASAVEPTELESAVEPTELASAVEPTELASAVEPTAVEKKKRVKKVKPDSDNLNHKISKKNKISNIESNNSDELILNQVTIDDISYFYDSNNNLYNNDTLIIGSFDPISLSISIS
jgi:hypothetical protein